MSKIELYERFVDGVDKEGEMANVQLKAIVEYGTKLKAMFRPDDQIPAWVQAKLAVVKDNLDEIFHRLDAMEETPGETETPMEAPISSDEAPEFDLSIDLPGEPDDELKSFDDYADGDKEEEAEEEPEEKED